MKRFVMSATASRGVVLLLLGGAALALPQVALGVQGGTVWPARLITVTGGVTAILASVLRTGPLVTVTALQAMLLTVFAVVGSAPPAALAWATAGAALLTAYLLAADVAAFTWPRRGLWRRVSTSAVVALVAIAVVCAVVAGPGEVSPLAVLGGLVGVIAAYALALGRHR
jgi:hypothetical protein